MIGLSLHGKASTMQSVSLFHVFTVKQIMNLTQLEQCVITSISSELPLTRRRIEPWPTLLCCFTGNKKMGEGRNIQPFP